MQDGSYPSQLSAIYAVFDLVSEVIRDPDYYELDDLLEMEFLPEHGLVSGQVE